MSIIRNTIKIIKLQKLEKKLAAAQAAPQETSPGEREEAKAKLFQLVQSQRDLRKLLERYGKTAADLDELYEMLCTCTGVERRRLFVPVETLVYRHSLKYLLDNADDLLHSEERRKTIAWVLSTYFKRNDILEVNEARYLSEVEYDKKRKAERAARKKDMEKKLAQREALKKARKAARQQEAS